MCKLIFYLLIFFYPAHTELVEVNERLSIMQNARIIRQAQDERWRSWNG
jgi:hypothetical protein